MCNLELNAFVFRLAAAGEPVQALRLLHGGGPHLRGRAGAGMLWPAWAEWRGEDHHL